MTPIQNLIIKRLGELCQTHSALVEESLLVEGKILETVELLKRSYSPKDGGKAEHGKNAKRLN